MSEAVVVTPPVTSRNASAAREPIVPIQTSAPQERMRPEPMPESKEPSKAQGPDATNGPRQPAQSGRYDVLSDHPGETEGEVAPITDNEGDEAFVVNDEASLVNDEGDIAFTADDERDRSSASQEEAAEQLLPSEPSEGPEPSSQSTYVPYGTVTEFNLTQMSNAMIRLGRSQESMQRQMLESNRTLVSIRDTIADISGILSQQRNEMQSLPGRIAELMIASRSQSRASTRRGCSVTPIIERGNKSPAQKGTNTVPKASRTRRPTVTVESEPEEEAMPPVMEQVEEEDSESTLAYITETPAPVPPAMFTSGFTTRAEHYRSRQQSTIPTQPPVKEDILESSRHDSVGTVAENSHHELPVSDSEFEQRVLFHKLDLLEKAKLPGSLYAQRPFETDSVYHGRLYLEARTSTRSEVRAAEAGRVEVRFNEPKLMTTGLREHSTQDPRIPKSATGQLPGSQPSGTRESNVRPSLRFQGRRTSRRGQDPSPPSSPDSGSSQREPSPPPSRRLPSRRPSPRRARQSLLLVDLQDEQQVPGIVVNRDRNADRTDEMIRDIVQDATRACQRRGANTVSLAKLGVKLPLPEYKGSDTLEAFMRFTKEVCKYLNLNNLLVPEYESYHTDLLGQMLQERAKNWFIHTVGANSDQQVTLTDTYSAQTIFR